MIGGMAERAVLMTVGLQRSAEARDEVCREMPITIDNIVVRSGPGESQNNVIGGGRIKSNSLISMPLKDLFFTLLVWISRLVRYRCSKLTQSFA